jgi:hypothetical protein
MAPIEQAVGCECDPLIGVSIMARSMYDMYEDIGMQLDWWKLELNSTGTRVSYPFQQSSDLPT